MRGPLFSGAIGSPVTLRRLVELLKGHTPVAVLGSAWLGGLALEGPVLLLARAEDRGKAAGHKTPAAPGATDRPLLVTAAGDALPVAPGRLGGLLVENLRARAPARSSAGMAGLLLRLADALVEGGMLLALDRTKDVAVEAEMATAFLAAGCRDIIQVRPRAGALITGGRAPEQSVRRALSGALGAGPGSGLS